MGPRDNSLVKIALLAGFIGVSAAILAAYRTPVTGYELDIYQGTPAAFWVGCGVALFVSAVEKRMP